MNRLALIDTNVVVSGLLTKNPSGPTALILDAMLAATLRFVVSPALVAVYRDVLLRPRIARAHGMDAPDVDALVRVPVERAPDGASVVSPRGWLHLVDA